MVANVPPPWNRRKQVLPTPVSDPIQSTAYCTRREEYVHDGACLDCFLKHVQLQVAFRLRSHCTDLHLVSSLPCHSPDRENPMDVPTLTPSRLPSSQEWSTLLDMAQTIARSGFLPSNLATVEKVAAIILKGRELGIPGMQSISHIHVIDGKLSCSAELMLALLARGGITWAWKEDGSDGESAVIEFYREGFAPVAGRFTMEDARRVETVAWENGEKKTVKLADRESWKNYPANLLRARAIANGARMIGPDLLTGMSYTPEELGATVDEEGLPAPSSPRPKPYVRFLKRCAEIQSAMDEKDYQTILSQFDLGSPQEVDEDDTQTMRHLVEALLEPSQAIAAG